MIQTILQNLAAPDKEFSPFPFWFFNDAFDKEKVRAQLADYVEKGVNGFVLHPRIGIPKEMEYLSEEYFDAVTYIVQTAAELDMKVVLYDEGMYPSGAAHGEVVRRHPEYASRGVYLAQDMPGQGEVVTQFADGRYLVYDYTHGTIRGIHFGEDDGEEGAPASADILNPQAVDCFIHLTHERYYAALSQYFGNTVIAFFTDEPCALGRNAGAYHEWLPGLQQEIMALGGDLQELEALFFGKENATTVIYHKLIKKHLRENFYAKLSQWCQSHGISLMGHPEASDDVEEELYFQIPGQDLIMRRVSPESGGLTESDSVQAKLPADIARLLGRRRNANECFGVCNRQGIPWYLKGEDMLWFINWLGIRGVNLYVPHAFYYSVAGARSGERPPDVGPNNIWWSYYRLISDYMKRISYLMTDSAQACGVAVLCDNNQVPYLEVAALYEHQIQFHYVPVALADRAKGQYPYVLNVRGEFNDTAFADSQIDTDTESLLAQVFSQRVIYPLTETPFLRQNLFSKNGITMALLSNEGTDTIDTEMHLPVCKRVITYDLWRGEYTCQLADASYHLILPPYTMRLLIFDMTDEIPIVTSDFTSLGDLTKYFTLTTQSATQAEYIYTPMCPVPCGNECFLIRGEEMAECWCNNSFVGVSLTSPHEFRIGSFLHPGANTIRVRFTANIANVYSDAKIPFGIGE